MRRYSKPSGMHLITCDHEYDVRYQGEGACGLEFRTCSDKSVVQKQLEHAGWTTRDVMEKGIKVSQDLCPHHTQTERQRMTSTHRYNDNGNTG